MSTAPAFIVHDGRLDSTEDLQQSLGLTEGSRLFVVSSNDREIVLRREETQPMADSRSYEEKMAAWDKLFGILPDNRTPEWLAEATEKKRIATEHLENLYASKLADPGDLMRAETAWEVADDELDFGPFKK